MSELVSKLEERVRDLVGGYLAGLPGGKYSPQQIARQLANEVASSSRADPRGHVFAPDQFTLSIHPDDAETLIGSASINQGELSRRLMRSLEGSGYLLAREPHITLATDPTLSHWEVRTIAWHSSDPLKFSAVTADLREKVPDQPPKGAFLIIDGNRNFPLDRPVVDIGRRLDNHLLLEDPHVSRKHAQIKVKDGRYTVLDLGSTSGTRVNGRLVKDHVLRPGDIINIAGIEMIYGEDPGGPPSVTPPYTPLVGPSEGRERISPLDMKTLRGIRRPGTAQGREDEPREDKGPESGGGTK